MSNIHCLIDFNNFAKRANHKDEGLCNSKGNRTGTVFYMLRMLKAIVEEYKPLSVTLFSDTGLNKDRLEFFPEYKKARREKKQLLTEEEKEEESSFRDQKKRFLEYAKNLGVKHIRCEEPTEADDLIAFISHTCKRLKPFTYKGNRQHKLLVISNDSDFHHLVNEVTDVVHMRRKKDDRILNIKNTNPSLNLFEKAIAGDTSDGISGIKGVGEKSIQKALQEVSYDFTNLDNLEGRTKFYEGCSLHENKKVRLIGEHRDIVERNIKIISLRYGEGFVSFLSDEIKERVIRTFLTDVDINLDNILKLCYNDEFTSMYIDIHTYFGFTSYLKGFNEK